MLSPSARMPARPPLRPITSRHNPIVHRFRAAAQRESDDDLVLVEGPTLVAEAARAGWQLVAVAFADDWLAVRPDDPLLETLDRDVDAIAVPRHVLETMSPAASPSGVVAIARAPERRSESLPGRASLIVIADGVQDPGNVGALARTAEAAGAGGLSLTGASADPLGWKALRGGMGSAFRLPIRQYPGAVDAIAAVQRAGFQVIALVAREGLSLYDVDFSPPTAVLVGAEGGGLPEAGIRAANIRATIPMCPPVESLNVAVAAAIALYEAARQRRTRRTSDAI